MKARFLALAALVLGLASCQTEPEGLDVNVGGEVDSYVTVSLPETTRATNSALGAFGNVDLNGTNGTDYTVRYIFEVYYGDTGTQKQVYYTDGKNASFPVRLVPNRHYNFVAWADIVEQPADDKMNKALPYEDTDVYYETSDLTDITIIDSEWVAMDEKRDAFTGYFNTAYDGDKKPYNGSKSINIKLTRPFAKLRVITTDMVELGNLGITPVSAKVTYSAFSHESFNALDGTYSDTAVEKTHTYTIADYADQTGANKVLFTDFFFADGNDVVKFQLDVHEKGVNEQNETTRIKLNDFTTDIPVKRNNLTTISGNILTDGNNIKVEVENDGKFEGEIEEKIVEVGNATDLQEAINEADEDTTVVLGGHINLNDGIITLAATRAGENAGLIVPAGKSVVLDLNGYTISAHDYATAGYALITNKGNLTINGEGTLKITGAENNRGWGAYSSVISNQPGGNLTVNAGVTIEHFGGTAMAYGIDNLTNGKGTSAIVTINGATVKSTYRPIRQFLNGVEATNKLYVNKDSRVESTGGNKAIWMQDPSKNANTGKLVVAEGAFVHSVYLDVTPGSTEWPVEVSVAASSLTDTSENKGIYTDGIPAGYEVVLENGVYTVLYTCAAKISDVEYPSLQAAVEAVKDGETIVLNRNIEQVDGVIITDKNITIDLNKKTYTVSEGANTNNRNFKVNGSSVVTIKNGTMIANGEITSGAYGTVRTEGTANVTLNDVKLYNYRGNGFNVKVCTGTTVTINNSEIYSQYGGGVEAAGGTIELTNVKIEQKGIYSGAAWNSVAIGVNGGGNVTVKSGNYSASAISTDANAAQGTWVAYVMSSGGTLNIKGGTFNGVVAETASAANACGLICADTKAIVNIYGGTFSSNGAILDMRNNTGGTPNPSATLFGGTFSADPRVSGLYASNLITVDSKSDIKEENGKWVVFVRPVAKIGDVEYETLEDAVAAAKAGDTITLVEDVTLAEELGLPAGIIFNGNGKQINGSIYAGGDLTFAGHTKVTTFSASYYNRVITIGEGACLEVTGGGRVSLAYGNTFNITGSIENAKTADKASIQPSLIIPAGISITGGNGAAMNVTNAYVKIGSTTSKPGVANGTFTFNFDNAIAEFTKELGFYEPTGGVTPTFVMNIKDSVFTTGTKLFVTAGSTVTVDNSNVPLGTYFRNSGEFTLKNGSEMTGATIQFGENGGNNGTINVDASTLTITTGNNKGHAFDGKGNGKINATNGATVSVEYYKDMTINVDATSTFTGTEVK